MAYRIKEYVYSDEMRKEEDLIIDRIYKLKSSHMAETLERQFLNSTYGLEDFTAWLADSKNYK